MPCWNCSGSIAGTDSYCRFCGKGQGKLVPWYYSHLGIIVLTVAVVGPFSIRFVWKSPLLSKQVKWVYTAAILIFTYYAASKFYGFYKGITSLLSGPLLY